MTSEEMNTLLSFAANMTPQWYAGFFDGEGCISSSYYEKKDQFGIHVSVSQKSPHLLVLIALRFPTELTVCGNKRGHSWYELHWSGRSVTPLLSHIKDSLTIKKRQAELALEFTSLIGTDGTKSSISHENYERRKEIHRELKRLNEVF